MAIAIAVNITGPIVHSVIQLAEVLVRLQTKNGGMKAFNPQADADIADRPKAISPLSSIDISKLVFFLQCQGLFDLLLS